MTQIKTVYLLGAGFNQCVEDWHRLKPPLATNFFQTILRSKKYTDGSKSEVSDKSREIL